MVFNSSVAVSLLLCSLTFKGKTEEIKNRQKLLEKAKAIREGQSSTEGSWRSTNKERKEEAARWKKKKRKRKYDSGATLKGKTTKKEK